MLEDRGERMLESEFIPPKSALDIFVKDMGLVCNAAEEQGFETPLASAALGLYLAGRDAGLGAEDDSGVIRVFRHRTASA
jgi:3-hydroxyisobutyrate dehydrogenase-like beta-hydroxyacid dehydrogenase